MFNKILLSALLLGLSVASFVFGDWEIDSVYNTGSNSTPQVAIDADANAVMVWSDETSGDIFFATRSGSGTAWSTPAIIAPYTAEANSGSPQVGVDAQGNALAIWASGNGSTNDLYSAYKPVGQSWSATPLLVALNAESYVLAVSPSGNAIAVWKESGVSQVIKASRFDFQSGVWMTPFIVSGQLNTQVLLPWVSINAGDEAVVAWSEEDGGGDLYVYSRDLIAADQMGPIYQLSEPNAVRVRVYLNDSGFTIAAWENTGPQVIEAATHSFGSAWSSAATLSSATSRRPRVVVDSIGRGIVNWANTATNRIQSAQYSEVSGWGGVQDVSSSGDLAFSNTQLVIDERGYAVALWGQDGGAQIAIFTATLFGSAWETPAVVYSGANIQDSLTLALSASGAAVVGWLQQNVLSSNTVRAAYDLTFIPLPPPQNVMGRIVPNQYILYQDLVYQVSWEVPFDLRIVSTRVYRDGVLLATIPVSQPPVFNDHRMIAGVSAYVYKVAFVDALGAEGPGVEVEVGP